MGSGSYACRPTRRSIAASARGGAGAPGGLDSGRGRQDRGRSFRDDGSFDPSSRGINRRGSPSMVTSTSDADTGDSKRRSGTGSNLRRSELPACAGPAGAVCPASAVIASGSTSSRGSPTHTTRRSRRRVIHSTSNTDDRHHRECPTAPGRSRAARRRDEGNIVPGRFSRSTLNGPSQDRPSLWVGMASGSAGLALVRPMVRGSVGQGRRRGEDAARDQINRRHRQHGGNGRKLVGGGTSRNWLISVTRSFFERGQV